jgi:hypothetical protein
MSTARDVGHDHVILPRLEGAYVAKQRANLANCLNKREWVRKRTLRRTRISLRTWETRKEQIANDAKLLSRRLEDQRAMNLKAIKAKLDGSLSKEDFELLKQSIDAEIKAIEQSIAALDAEKSSYAEVLQETEHEALDFVQAWKVETFNDRRRFR